MEDRTRVTLAAIESVILDECHALTSGELTTYEALTDHERIRKLAEEQYLEVLYSWEVDTRAAPICTCKTWVDAVYYIVSPYCPLHGASVRERDMT